MREMKRNNRRDRRPKTPAQEVDHQNRKDLAFYGLCPWVLSLPVRFDDGNAVMTETFRSGNTREIIISEVIHRRCVGRINALMKLVAE